MKKVISNFYSLEKQPSQRQDIQASFLAFGDGGQVQILVYSSQMIEIIHLFTSISIGSRFSNGSDFMKSQWQPVRKGLELQIIVEEDLYAFRLQILSKTEKDVVVVLEKIHGIISIFREGKLIHGGKTGNNDTVIPFHPLRCLAEQDNSIPKGRYNFPLESNDAFYGLGDKTGFPNRRGRRFKMYNRDSLGYDASYSDPLYKSVPFFMKHNKAKNILCGLFFPAVQLESVDFGNESPFFYSVEVKGGPFSQIIIMGDSYHDILRSYCELTGFPVLPPLFSFGFFGSSMNYVESDDAAKRIESYFSAVEHYHIPCEGMYVSSGYLKSPDGKRYAFLWNKKKFPDHAGFLKSLEDRGYHLCMNIKPGILTSHPWYGQLAEKNFFITDRKGSPYIEFFWGGEASFIDFSNDKAKAWWKSQLKSQYLEHGCSGIWNDNNELEIEDPEIPASIDKTLYPVKMTEAAFEAFKEFLPSRRPWIYSRAGYTGIQRFSRTWTGDNVSDWRTLKFNQYMGIGLGLSGIPFYGHDLGGFFGDFPGEQLLIRSCQSAVFQPRFVIHSWRENGIPTEPWSYPESLPIIRKMIEEHYRFIPYTYGCALESSLTGVPIERPLFLEFPDDQDLDDTTVVSLYGNDILKIPAVDPDVHNIIVRLPQDAGWYSPHQSMVFPGGRKIDVDLPFDEIRYFIRTGSIVPTAPGLKKLDSGFFPLLEFLVFPHPEFHDFSYQYCEDDGITDISLGNMNKWRISCQYNSANEGELSMEAVSLSADIISRARRFRFTLPRGFYFGSSSETTVEVSLEQILETAVCRWEFTGVYIFCDESSRIK